MSDLLRFLSDALVPRRYLRVRVSYDLRGPSCVIEPHELESFVDGNDTAGYVVTPVWMTRRAFNKLGDFNGF